MLPDWIFENTNRPYGVRLPKREQLRAVPRGTGYNNARLNELGKVVQGNLPNQEYEFWMGSQYPAALYAHCRFCNVNAMSVDERRAHLRDSKANCLHKIKQISQLLRKDMKCLVCDRHTKKHPWGFPLCSEACIAEWKFGPTPTRAFREALEIIRRG